MLNRIYLICTFLLASMQLQASELTNYLNNLHTLEASLLSQYLLKIIPPNKKAQV